ncbi:MAG: DNA-3-methyladenine glycosylase family protein [Endozoicomonas sp.]
MKTTTWSLAYKPPFNWQSMLGFFQHRAIPGVELITDDQYLRSIAIDEARGWIRLGHDPLSSALRLEINMDRPGFEETIIARTRQLMDLDAPMAEIEARLCSFQPFADIIPKHRGTRLPGCWDPFEFSIRAILGQQISVKAATTLAGRIARGYGETVAMEMPEGISHYFPAPGMLDGVSFDDIGLTRSRKATLQNLATRVASGGLELTANNGLEDFVARIVKEPGIGPWTAHYLAMRGLSQPDAFPASDLGIIKMLSSEGRPIKPKQIEALAESWRPWRAYAAIYLWQGSSQ